MPCKISACKIHVTLAVGFATAALAISLGSPAATAANGGKYAKSHRAHHERAFYATHRVPRGARAGAQPYGPEYGFLPRIPANAIRMPGYIFVPGVGILGASCDLPTSACSNQYRDIQ